MGSDAGNAKRPHGRNSLVGGDPGHGAGTGSMYGLPEQGGV